MDLSDILRDKNYRQPKVILGGSADILTLGLGQSTGNTFFAVSTTGRRLGRGILKDIVILFLNILFVASVASGDAFFI